MKMPMVLETESRAVYRMIDSSQCPGCPSNLATKLVLQLVFEVCEQRKDHPIVIGQGCGIGRNLLQRSGIGTHDSAAVGIRAAMEMRGFDRPLVIIDGDGQLDMGFDGFTGAFQQGHPYVHIICDNQSYAASGNHGTGMSDLLARVSSRPTGRISQPEGRVAMRKQPAMMIMFSGARYSATASPVHMQDFERKIIAAMDNLPAFIQVFTPCNISWGYNDDQAAYVTKLGVTSGIWPLWEWKQGVFRRTVRLNREKIDEDLRAYLGSQQRYSHLTDAEVQEMRQYVDHLNTMVDRLAVAFAGSSPTEVETSG